MKKYIIALICFFVIILSVVFSFNWLPVKFFVGGSYEKATYVDYSKSYDFILNSTRYYEKTFNEGWYASLSTGGTILVYGEGVPLNHTAYYLTENNDGKYGIKILDILDKEIYAFPSDIPYPDFGTEPPDTVSIYTSSDEDEVVLESEKDLTQIKKITESVYDKSVYEQLPEELKNNEEISQIAITLHWDNYPYYFEQILTKSADGEFVPEITRPD